MQRIDPTLEGKQVASLKAVKDRRDAERVEHTLQRLHEAANGSANLVPFICDAVEAYATVGEISATLKRSFGKFRPMVTI